MSRTATAIQHSWSIHSWPTGVWPHSIQKARYTIRANKDALIAAGVLTRVGRELVVLGARWSRWLEKKSADVPGYECPANVVSATDKDARHA